MTSDAVLAPPSNCTGDLIIQTQRKMLPIQFDFQSAIVRYLYAKIRVQQILDS